MPDLRKQIFVDLFVNIWTLGPFLAGASMLLMSAVFASPFLTFFGVLSIIGSAVAGGLNLLFNGREVMQRAYKNWQAEQDKLQQSELDILDKKLRKTKTTKDEIALRNLRHLYNALKSDIRAGKISDRVPPDMLLLIDNIFNTCVQRLNQFYDMTVTVDGLDGDLKAQIEAESASLMEQVNKSAMDLSRAITQVRSIKFETQKKEMRELQERLERQLEVAKEISQINNNNSEKYAKYLEQEKEV